MFCFTAFTHIAPIFTENSIPTFFRLTHVFLHDRTISGFVHVSCLLIGKGALIENMLILKINANFRVANALRAATLLQRII